VRDDPSGPESERPDAREERDPASYAYWAASGYQGRPPQRRGYRWGYFAISLALVALVLILLALLRSRGM
jgi:hypothetical protein